MIDYALKRIEELLNFSKVARELGLTRQTLINKIIKARPGFSGEAFLVDACWRRIEPHVKTAKNLKELSQLAGLNPTRVRRVLAIKKCDFTRTLSVEGRRYRSWVVVRRVHRSRFECQCVYCDRLRVVQESNFYRKKIAECVCREKPKTH
jgi:hypothetical protein